MKALTNWMVGLDMTTFDDHMIRFVHHLSQLLTPEEIYFIHIKKRHEIPSKFLATGEKSREELQKEMESKVFKIFKDHGAIKCEVHEGTPEFDMWRESYLHHTDLLILGEKSNKAGRKIVPEKMVRKSFCSVLLVPETTEKLNHIWVAIDNSDGSKDALDAALDVTQHNKNAKITAHSVVEFQSSDLIKPDMLEDYKTYVKSEARTKVEKLIASVGNKAKVDIKLTEKVYANVADHIKQEAEENGADLIIMVAGGKSRFTAFFLGSTTSQLIQYEKSIATLILKEKVDKVKAWDILTNL